MSSRLFKHQMATNNRPPILPHLATSMGEIYGYNTKTDEFIKVFNLGFTANGALSVKFSPDGRYVAFSVGGTNSNGGWVYKRTATGYVKQTLPGTQNTWQSAAWSPDSKYLYVASNNNNGGFYWYRLNADGTFTAMPAFPGMNLYTKSVSVSPDGKYIAVGFSQAPYLSLYKNDNGTITKLTIPSAIVPTGTNGRLSWIGDSLPYISSSSNFGFVYTVIDDVITRAASTGVDFYYAFGSAASKDGQYYAHGNLYGLDYYKFNKTTGVFTKLARYEQAGARAYGVSFSDDGNYVAAASNGGDQVFIYRRVGDTLVPIVIPVPIKPGAGGMQDVSFATPLFL